MTALHLIYETTVKLYFFHVFGVDVMSILVWVSVFEWRSANTREFMESIVLQVCH